MASKNKKEIKPIPFPLAVVMVLAAFIAMAAFVCYLVVPNGTKTDESSTFSLDEMSFEEEESSEPPPPVIVEVKEHMSDADVGDVVKFGAYDQNANTDDGPEEIEWVVMEKQEEKLLLVSRYALECKSYNDERTDAEWQSSSLCGWLNGDFAKTAFSAEELENIVSTNELGKIFILSAEESARYYEYDSWRATTATETAVSSGARVQNGGCFYWLRDAENAFAKYVYSNGKISDTLFAVDYDIVAVRPAIWVSANTETELEDETSEASASSETGSAVSDNSN